MATTEWGGVAAPPQPTNSSDSPQSVSAPNPEAKRWTLPPPPETQQALVALYILADYRRIPSGASKDWIKSHGVVSGLYASSRKAAIRLVRESACYACSGPVPEGSPGDHVVATAEDGPPGFENYLPICRSCNSSKGKRDLLDWWVDKSRSFLDLTPDVLTVYASVRFGDAHRLNKLNEAAPEPLARTVAELAETLPTDEHRYYLWQRVQWVTGRRW